MPKSQMERLWMIGAGFAAFIMILVGYMIFISPQRDQTSQVEAQVATAQQQNGVLAARISSLTAQNKNLATYQKAVAAASAALPSASGMPDFLRTLQSIGNATLTNVAMLTVGVPAPFMAQAVAGSAPTSTASPTATPSAQPTSTSTKAASPSIYVLPVTAQVTGPVNQLSEFLRQLQSVQPRAVLISQITETNGSTSGTTQPGASSAASLQLTMSIFVQPNEPTGLPSGTSTP